MLSQTMVLMLKERRTNQNPKQLLFNQPVESPIHFLTKIFLLKKKTTMTMVKKLLARMQSQKSMLRIRLQRRQTKKISMRKALRNKT